MPERNIYEQKTKNGVYRVFRYGHEDSKKLFTIIYKGGQDKLFLKRKYTRFLKGFRIDKRSDIRYNSDEFIGNPVVRASGGTV